MYLYILNVLMYLTLHYQQAVLFYFISFHCIIKNEYLFKIYSRLHYQYFVGERLDDVGWRNLKRVGAFVLMAMWPGSASFTLPTLHSTSWRSVLVDTAE